MIDLNDSKQLEKLDKAVRSDDGQVIIDYLFDNLKELKVKRDKIDLDKNDIQLGQEYRGLETARREIEKITNFLTSRYE